MKDEAIEIYLASANPHKIKELQQLADDAGVWVNLRPASDLGGMPEVVEDAGTFHGNARKKARVLRGLAPPDAWVMADDSGICVDALSGAPGVESAYFAGPEGDDKANLQKLVQAMSAVPTGERGAHYLCLLLIIDGEDREHAFEGKCEGQLAFEPVGQGGFGYDPLFIPTGYSETFGVLSAQIKQVHSHRANAWTQVCNWIRQR